MKEFSAALAGTILIRFDSVFVRLYGTDGFNPGVAKIPRPVAHPIPSALVTGNVKANKKTLNNYTLFY